MKSLTEFLKSQLNQPQSYSIHIREDEFDFTICCNDDFIELRLLDDVVTDVAKQAIKRFMYKHRQIN